MINTYPEDFTDCQEIDVLDLSSWKDEPESAIKGTSGLRSVKSNKCAMRYLPCLKKIERIKVSAVTLPPQKKMTVHLATFRHDWRQRCC